MIMEYPQYRSTPFPVRETLGEDFLVIKGYLVPRDLLSQLPEQAIDLGWLEACGSEN